MIARCLPGKPIFLGSCQDESAGRMVWRIISPFSFISSEGYVLEIPAGFLTDYCSAPAVVWPIIPVRDGVYDAAACVHDYAVRWRKVLGLSINDCHDLFWQAMIARDVPLWKAAIMYRAVWLFYWMRACPGDGTTPPDLLRRVNPHALSAA